VRRLENLGEDRNELLRDQHNRLNLLREERQMLIERLQRESEERQQLMGVLAQVNPQLLEDLQRDLQRHPENALSVEQQQEEEQERLRMEQELRRLEEELEREQEQRAGIQRELERFGPERQGLSEALETERHEHREARQRAEQQEQDRARLEQEINVLKTKLERQERAPTRSRVKRPEAPLPWWRRPALIAGLLFGVLVAWFASLVVALNLLSP
jgi:chromosome segregation ATPase